MDILEKAKILTRAGSYDSCGPRMCEVKVKQRLGGWVERAKPFIEIGGMRQMSLREF